MAAEHFGRLLDPHLTGRVNHFAMDSTPTLSNASSERRTLTAGSG